MKPDITKIIIIVNDQRELQILHSRLIELSDELRLSRKVIKSVYGHYEVCFDNTIRIFILLKDYKYTDGWHCDYFAISTFDIDYVEKWQNQLSPHGKELTSFNEIRDKIKELCLKEKNEMKFKVGDIVRIMNHGVARAGLDWRWVWSGRISYIGNVDLNLYPYKVDFEHQRDYGCGYAYFSKDELRLITTRDIIDDYLRSLSHNKYEMSSITLPKNYKISSAVSAYVDADINATFDAYKESVLKLSKESREIFMPKIKNVIFNDPATIVFWADGTKTVVKAQGDDKFDPEKGLAMAISKKALGNKGNYCNELKKWLPEEAAPMPPFAMDDLKTRIDNLRKTLANKLGVPEKIFEEKKVRGYCPYCKYHDTAVNDEPRIDCFGRKTKPNWEPKND